MRKSLATSLLLGALLLTGCTSDAIKSDNAVNNEQNDKQYKLSNEFVINNIKYKDLKQYKQQSEKMISRVIQDYVKKEGFTEDGYNSQGFDRRGYNRNHVNENGFGEDGYNLNNVSEEGFTREGRPSVFKAPYDKFGYDVNGYDEKGFNKLGYDVDGYNLDGFNKMGESKIKTELSINEYLVRDWATISTKELFEMDMYFPLVEQAMKENEPLVKEYYEEGMHPFSKEAYYINLVCNNYPSMMDDLLPLLRMDSVSKLNISNSTNRDSQYIFKSGDGDTVHLLNKEEFLPQRFEVIWKKLSSMDIGEEVDLEDTEGFLSTYKLVERRKLNDVEQKYVDFARHSIKESKGKWALAHTLFNELFYKAVDQQFKEIKLTKNSLDEVNKSAQSEWPKAYLTDSNEAIEGYNDEAREEFIEALMDDLIIYEQSELK